jgi:hypothetical protein
MKNMQKKRELLKEAAKELEDAVKNIMTECTQMWRDKVDKFDKDAAKSVLVLYQFNLFCLAVPTQFVFSRFLVMIL